MFALVLAPLMCVASVDAQGTALQHIEIQRVSPTELATWVEIVRRQIPDLGTPPRIVRKDVVIFIPGVLGSALRAPGGKVIWPPPILWDPQTGKFIWPPTLGVSAQDLALPKNEAEPASATILDQYFDDVHQEMKDELAGLAEGEAEILHFPYDWRHDIERIADWFDLKLKTEWRETLRDARVTIVAHSMGGLVAWTWKNRHYRPADLQLSKLVLLGSPLEGSCEMLRMLLEGYKPVPGKRTKPFVEALYEVLFGPLRPAAYTFPSVFQVLPPVGAEGSDPRTACLMVEKPKTKLNPVSHFDASVWDRHLLSLLAGSPWYVRWTTGWVGWYDKAVWEELGLTRPEFLKRLGDLQRRSQSFRQSLNLNEGLLAAPGPGLEGRVRYFFSQSHETTFQVTVEAGSIAPGGTLPNWGDGRVLVHSAQNGTRHTSTPIPLTLSHGELVKDPIFIGWLRGELRRLRRDPLKATLEVLWEDNRARSLLVERAKIVALTDLGVDPLNPGRAGLALAELNTAALGRAAERAGLAIKDPALDVYRIGHHLLWERSDPTRALAVYETVLALGGLPKRERNEAAVIYSKLLLDLGQYRRALAVLKASPEVADTAEMRPYVLNNLAVAYSGVGDIQIAKVLYAQAGALGLKLASENLAKLPLVTLSVNPHGPPPGAWITSTPAGISCPETCSATFVRGTRVILTSTSAVTGEPAWAGCKDANRLNCVVMMSDDQNLTVRY